MTEHPTVTHVVTKDGQILHVYGTSDQIKAQVIRADNEKRNFIHVTMQTPKRDDQGRPVIKKMDGSVESEPLPVLLAMDMIYVVGRDHPEGGSDFNQGPTGAPTGPSITDMGGDVDVTL